MPFPHLGAFESTKIHGSGQDILGTTNHITQWREDLDRLHASGINQLRYPVPWHRIEREPGVFDWSWIDGPLGHMRTLGLQPILDPLHHISFPDWLENGFANPQFPDLYVRFIQQVAQRYPWVERYTVVNEPLPTLVLCAFTGAWYPHRTSDRDFVTMAVNVARTICLAGAALRKLNSSVSLHHIDSCEHHVALEPHAGDWVAHANCRRFLFHDLTLGLLGRDHPLLPYLQQHGFTDDDRHWFQDHAGRIDVLGLDYYAHSEMQWRWDTAADRPRLDFPCRHPLGFAAVARQYVDRFGLPVLLSETNVGGSVTDRITWLKIMENQAEKLAATADFRGFCWFPSLDATDWDSLCTVANRRVSPMGVWSLGPDCQSRLNSELATWYGRLARGECDSYDLPAYHLKAPLDKDLAGFTRLLPGANTWRFPEDSDFNDGRAAGAEAISSKQIEFRVYPAGTIPVWATVTLLFLSSAS